MLYELKRVCLSLLLGEEVQLWYDKESDKQRSGADDVFVELPNLIPGVSECCVFKTVSEAAFSSQRHLEECSISKVL